MKLYTSFCNAPSAEALAACEKASGVDRRIEWLYDQDPRLCPQRAFRDSADAWTVQGSGFPRGDEVIPVIPAPDRGRAWVNGREVRVQPPPVVILNSEYYSTRRENLKAAMRAWGLQYHRTGEAAQMALVDFQIKTIQAVSDLAAAVGIYGLAPFEDNTDHEHLLCLEVGAYCPSLYCARPGEPPAFRPFERHMPTKPVWAVVSDQGWSGSGGTVGVDDWRAMLKLALRYGATGVIWWRDCSAPMAEFAVTESLDRLDQAAVEVGVGIE